LEDLSRLGKWIAEYEEAVTKIPELEGAEFSIVSRGLQTFLGMVIDGLELVKKVAAAQDITIRDGDTLPKLRNLLRVCEKDNYSIILVQSPFHCCLLIPGWIGEEWQ
jgi:hypothetical protein